MGYDLVAIVPMKGHSERIKNKNLRDFNGKPLLYYILDSLYQSRVVSRICVDTDSNEINDAVIAFFPGTDVIIRPQRLRGDRVSMNSIIEYDMSMIEARHYLQTHVTNPLLKPETIRAAYEKYINNLTVYDSLFAVNRLQTRLYNENIMPINHNPNSLIRTQDLPPVYEENSNMYFFSKDSFKKANARIGLNPQVFEMNPLESVDIDEESDFVLAEQIYKLYRNEVS
jgi:CMP-N-acetylneuraminic acid synthetase